MIVIGLCIWPKIQARPVFISEARARPGEIHFYKARAIIVKCGLEIFFLKNFCF